jgi:hypothetical protein
MGGVCRVERVWTGLVQIVKQFAHKCGVNLPGSAPRP